MTYAVSPDLIVGGGLKLLGQYGDSSFR
jgi:hypothetical protein